ncbi:MAG: hypothetical protein FWC00_05595 [Firmicutes bacterium]|nr:hypothetical protein [Bacillota bacterium]
MIYLLFIPWILLAVLANVMYKINKKPTLHTLFIVDFMGLILTLVLFGFSLFFFDNPFENITWRIIGLIFARTVIGVGAFAFFLLALKRLPLSIFKPLTLIRMFPLLLLGMVFFGDGFTIVALVLAIVIFCAGVALSIVSNQKGERNKNRKAYLIGLLWLLAYIASSVLIMPLVRYIAGYDINAFTFVLIFILMSVVFQFFILLAVKQSPFKAIKESWNDKILWGAAVGDTFWMAFMIPLSFAMNLGLIDAIMVSATALTVLVGAVVLKEKAPWHAYVLIAIILAAAVAMPLLS